MTMQGVFRGCLIPTSLLLGHGLTTLNCKNPGCLFCRPPESYQERGVMRCDVVLWKLSRADRAFVFVWMSTGLLALSMQNPASANFSNGWHGVRI